MSPDPTIAELATTRPLSVRVFHRHTIDFCCAGGRSLSEVCTKKGLDPKGVLDEITAEEASARAPALRWDAVPLGELVDHLLVRYHEPLDAELPRLGQLWEKVCRVHGETDPTMFAELGRLWQALRDDLEPHMAKEEQILFPWIRRGQGASADGPIAVMEEEHERVGEILTEIRAITHDYQLPPGACRSYTALWQGLEALEADLHEHIHLENHVLFPRALAS